MTGKSVIFGMLGDESKESGISNARETIGLLLGHIYAITNSLSP